MVGIALATVIVCASGVGTHSSTSKEAPAASTARVSRSSAGGAFLAALHLETAEAQHRLGSEAEVRGDRNLAFDQEPDRSSCAAPRLQA